MTTGLCILLVVIFLLLIAQDYFTDKYGHWPPTMADEEKRDEDRH